MLKTGTTSFIAFLFAAAVLMGGGSATAQIVEVEDDFGRQRAYFGLTTDDTGLMQFIGQNKRTATVELSDDRVRALGAVVGKALENYEPGGEGEALVLMLVMRL